MDHAQETRRSPKRICSVGGGQHVKVLRGKNRRNLLCCNSVALTLIHGSRTKNQKPPTGVGRIFKVKPRLDRQGCDDDVAPHGEQNHSLPPVGPAPRRG